MKLNKDNRIPQLENIIRNAGDAIMDIYTLEDRGVEMKSDESPLTRADKAAHKIIFEGIRDIDPDYGFIGEENKNASYADRKNMEFNWMVDPLDGTKEFISRNGEFTVNIALIQNQKPILGYVYIPASEDLYWARAGQGAWRMKKNSDTPKKLKASTFSWENKGLRVLCSRSHLNEKTKNFLSHLNQPEPIAAGSALKFLRIANGDAEIYPRLAPTMEWDTAAAEIVLLEAGGKVRVWPTLESLTYNKEDLTNPHFIACGKEENGERLREIKDQMST